jgi:hypothetical protein
MGCPGNNGVIAGAPRRPCYKKSRQPPLAYAPRWKALEGDRIISSTHAVGKFHTPWGGGPQSPTRTARTA